MAENSIIKIDNLIFRYENGPSAASGTEDVSGAAEDLISGAVIKGVDLAVEQGSCVAVIGRNGSGE